MALASRSKVEQKAQPRCALDDDPTLQQRLVARVRQGGILKHAAAREGVPMMTLHEWLKLGRDPRDARSRPVHVAFADAVDRAIAEFAEAVQNQVVHMAFGVRAPPPKKGEPKRIKASFPALKLLATVIDPDTYGLRARGGLHERPGVVINVLDPAAVNAPRGAFDATPDPGRGYLLPEAAEDVD